MNIPCPTCGSQVELNSSPIRGPANDGSEAWVCLKCPAIVCVDCYHGHVRKQHLEMLGEIKKPKKK
jgi:hypothetical protein